VEHLICCLMFGMCFLEFIDVGKKQRALDALYDVIKSKRHRTWQKIHEPIMEKYLDLCVELKKSHIAKEGLYQYKNICQQVLNTFILVTEFMPVQYHRVPKWNLPLAICSNVSLNLLWKFILS